MKITELLKQDAISKATGAEIDTGTDDAKFATALALANSDYTKLTSGTADPTGGSDGDIYFKYI